MKGPIEPLWCRALPSLLAGVQCAFRRCTLNRGARYTQHQQVEESFMALSSGHLWLIVIRKVSPTAAGANLPPSPMSKYIPQGCEAAHHDRKAASRLLIIGIS
eukprot:1141018-Pelagomonas_calceolata.AAC.9